MSYLETRTARKKAAVYLRVLRGEFPRAITHAELRQLVRVAGLTVGDGMHNRICLALLSWDLVTAGTTRATCQSPRQRLLRAASPPAGATRSEWVTRLASFEAIEAAHTREPATVGS